MRSGLTAVLAATLVVSIWASEPIPERLSQTGLYLPGTQAVDPQNRAFAPQYPLWTDGARKARWMRLPPGATIDARNVDQWEFPIGTRFWKEFAFDGRKVETRMLWRASEHAWSFASYVWNDSQTDAVLAPEDGVRGVAEVVPGKRHTIPSREDCRTCHDNGASAVLGFTALQLSTDRDPLAPHGEPSLPGMVTLRTLLEERIVEPSHPQLTARAPRIPGDDRTRAMLGYLTANCGHCHNEQSPVATVRFPLLMPAYPSAARVDETITALLTRTTKWEVPAAESGTTSFVKPGAPELSAAFVRMRSRRPSSQMPPLGTVVPDHQAMDLMAAWIQDLSQREGTRTTSRSFPRRRTARERGAARRSTLSGLSGRRRCVARVRSRNAAVYRSSRAGARPLRRTRPS